MLRFVTPPDVRRRFKMPPEDTAWAGPEVQTAARRPYSSLLKEELFVEGKTLGRIE
jgi:hypothetical protein